MVVAKAHGRKKMMLTGRPWWSTEERERKEVGRLAEEMGQAGRSCRVIEGKKRSRENKKMGQGREGFWPERLRILNLMWDFGIDLEFEQIFEYEFEIEIWIDFFGIELMNTN